MHETQHCETTGLCQKTGRVTAKYTEGSPNLKRKDIPLYVCLESQLIWKLRQEGYEFKSLVGSYFKIGNKVRTRVVARW